MRDLNVSAKLTLSMILLTLVACSGGSGDDDEPTVRSLSNETPLPIMGVCKFGGVQIDSGPDTNGDGVLQMAEIASSETSCDSADSPELDTELRQMVSDLGLTGDAAAGRALPSVSDPLAQLGMQLFFSKGLSGDLDAACVSCHHPQLGGGDALTLPIGVAAEVHDLLGPGRRHLAGSEGFDGGPTVPRNSPTTFNLALWDKTLFWDGRIESLTGTAGTNGSDGPIRTPDVPLW